MGNLAYKTSDVTGDDDVTGFDYGNIVHQLESVSVNGTQNTLAYDANGNITAYNATAGNDKFFDWNSQNQLTKVTVGGNREGTLNFYASEAFSYNGDGQRYYRESKYNDSGTTYTDKTYYAESFESMLPANNPDFFALDTEN